MTADRPLRRHVIRVRNLNYIFITVVTVFALFLTVVGLRTTHQYKNLLDRSQAYMRAQGDVRRAQTASDFMTEQVISFVMSGNTTCVDAYYEEASVHKNRDRALADIEALALNDALTEAINAAAQKSTELMDIERRIIHYAAVGYGIPAAELSQDVAAATLDPTVDTPEKCLAKARELAFGEDYTAHKQTLRANLDDVMDSVTQATEVLERRESVIARQLLVVLATGTAVMMPVCIIVFLVVSRQVITPLNQAVRDISAGRRIKNVFGADEIRYVLDTYNEFYDDSIRAHQNLRQEAECDALTGVRNRGAYEKTCAALKGTNIPLAVMILDIDYFKAVNDNYGHAAGDQALQKVAHLLAGSFRAQDMLFRIGGDEFAVVMTDMLPENKNVICEKIGALNTRIGTPEKEGEPALSVSAGVAFSKAGMSDDLMERADAALYEKKHTSEVGFAPEPDDGPEPAAAQ